jgi:hypothetical protein
MPRSRSACPGERRAVRENARCVRVTLERYAMDLEGESAVSVPAGATTACGHRRPGGPIEVHLGFTPT